MSKIDEDLESFDKTVKEPKIINRTVFIQHSIIPFAFKGEHECRDKVFNKVILLTVDVPLSIGEKITAIHEL